MSVVNTTFIITDIIELQKAEMEVGGFTFMKNPDLDMYQIHAILKSYVEKTTKGRKLLEKLGHGAKLSELQDKYLLFESAFTAIIPVTHKTLNENKYHIGKEIKIAYYPVGVKATFHMGDKRNGK